LPQWQPWLKLLERGFDRAVALMVHRKGASGEEPKVMRPERAVHAAIAAMAPLGVIGVRRSQCECS